MSRGCGGVIRGEKSDHRTHRGFSSPEGGCETVHIASPGGYHDNKAGLLLDHYFGGFHRADVMVPAIIAGVHQSE